MLRLSRPLAVAALILLSAAVQPVGAEGTTPSAPEMAPVAGHPSSSGPGMATAQRKRELVRALVTQLDRPGADRMLMDAVGRAGALVDYDLTGTPAMMSLTLTVEGQPVVDAFRLDGDQRLVIDLYNTVNFNSGRALHLQGDVPVRAVRSSQFTVEPQFVSRVVLDLDDACTYRVRSERGRVIVQLTPVAQIDAPGAAFAAECGALVAELDHQQSQLKAADSRFSELAARLAYDIDARERELHTQLRTAAVANPTGVETAMASFSKDRAAADQAARADLAARIEKAASRIHRQREAVGQLLSAYRSRVVDETAAREQFAIVRAEIEALRGEDFEALAAVEKKFWQQERAFLGQLTDLPTTVASEATPASSDASPLRQLARELDRLRDETEAEQALKSTPPVAQTSKAGQHLIEAARTDAVAALEAAQQQMKTLTNELAVMHELVQAPADPVAPVAARPVTGLPQGSAVTTDPATGLLLLPAADLAISSTMLPIFASPNDEAQKDEMASSMKQLFNQFAAAQEQTVEPAAEEKADDKKEETSAEGSEAEKPAETKPAEEVKPAAETPAKAEGSEAEKPVAEAPMPAAEPVEAKPAEETPKPAAKPVEEAKPEAVVVEQEPAEKPAEEKVEVPAEEAKPEEAAEAPAEEAKPAEAPKVEKQEAPAKVTAPEPIEPKEEPIAAPVEEKSPVTVVAQDAPDEGQPANTKKILYEIQKGDSLSRLSTKFGVKQSDISQWNDLADDVIKLGECLVLYVPDGSAPADAPVVAEVAEMAEEKPAEATAPAPEVKPEEAAPETAAAVAKPYKRVMPASGDPLDQLVNIDFREMELSNVVALLASKAQINVIAGTEVTGTVTANLKNVPLRDALEMLLRLNGLGVVEESGIFRIVPYEDALAERRLTRIVSLSNARASEVQGTLDSILAGSPYASVSSIAATDSTNIIVLSGPEAMVDTFEKLAMNLDIGDPVLPTVTAALKLNYAEPADVATVVESMLTKEVGKASQDQRGRHLIVTDYPVVIEQVRELVKAIDMPVKQVAVDSMIVDAVLSDRSQTGVSWLVDALQNYTRHVETFVDNTGQLIQDAHVPVGDMQTLNLAGTAGNLVNNPDLDALALTVGVLTEDVNIRATIAAEVISNNAEILANPVVVTMENKPATIEIVSEIPYQEITQSTQGPPVSSTAFKDVGVSLEVTPRVTHDNDILVELAAKESSAPRTDPNTGIPIEERREASTNVRTNDGRTIFIGGLRQVTDSLNVNKMPILGDVPVISALFRNTDANKIHTELLVFLTCKVLGEELPELTIREQAKHDKLQAVPETPDAQRAMFRAIVKPQEQRDPIWKWRRPQE
ncbi:MAG: AMIN domain-containing protein [bacterium]|nr:AMIN domain-containing protein [bacterium]